MYEYRFQFPCSCCQPGATSVMECRSRSATASLIGFEEFADNSSPWRFYKKKTGSGGFTRKIYAASAPFCDESSRLGTNTGMATGEAVYDDAGSLSAGIFVFETGYAPSTFGPSSSCLGGIGSLLEIIDTKTTHAGVEHPGACFGSFPASIFEGVSLVDTLSEEDTEEAAIARAPVAFSDWALSERCCAGIDLRVGSARSFGFSETEFRITVTGHGLVILRVSVVRSVRGLGNFLPFAVMEYPLDLSEWEGGVAVISDAIPNAPGYDTCVVGHTVYIVPTS